MRKKRWFYPVILTAIGLFLLVFFVSCAPETVEGTVTAEVTLTPVPGSETISKLLQTSNSDIDTLWKGSPHANTQADVASELADERSGQTPDEVIHGVDAENCIACHGPTAILANGGMSEAQALDYFFTIVDGKFTTDTAAENVSAWTNVACTACHNVPNDYPDSPVTLALFESQTGKYFPVRSASVLCGQCHGNLRFKTDHVTFDTWASSKHSNTQADVAVELAEARSGQTPDEVIQGQNSENCIACHAPTAVLANGGMDEAQALDYFFTTSDGKFTTDAISDHSAEWPSVACTTCHDQHNPDKPAYFDSATKKHVVMGSASELCGQCHGSLRFSDTDHLTFDAWKISKHSNTQADVAVELAEARSGQTPDEVIQGQDPENCIACHAPTAVLANGGMNEAQTLGYFFTTSDGKFMTDVASDHSVEWPSVACTACHDQHNPDKPAYFNAAIKGYEPVASADELCGQCHGSLRFPDTDHLSYDIRIGTGGIGVSDQQTMPGATCSDCHMFVSGVDDSNSSMQHGHSWAIAVEEEDGGSTIACTRCHPDKDAETANAAIAEWKSDFQSLYDTVQGNVAAAEDAMQVIDNMDLQAKLDEAQHNLGYAESDESGGFHNHNYLMTLLTDANDRALEVLSELGK